MAALPSGSLLVLDPDDGPGERVDPRYSAAVHALRSGTDALLYGYVDTDYGLRPSGDVARDVESFVGWYGVDGIFLDQVLPRAEQLAYYSDICATLRGAGLRVALNPGQPEVPAPYWDMADELVTFEGTGLQYLDGRGLADPPASTGAVSWHLVYDVADAAAMRDVVATARRRGAGRLLVTEGGLPNPWDRVPAYWSELIDVMHDGTGATV